MKTLYLYTTLGCHLCEQAQELAWPLLSRYGLRLQSVEIADDAALLERFGVRIPVLAVEGDVEGLGWPFDASMLTAYLSSRC